MSAPLITWRFEALPGGAYALLGRPRPGLGRGHLVAIYRPTHDGRWRLMDAVAPSSWHPTLADAQRRARYLVREFGCA